MATLDTNDPRRRSLVDVINPQGYRGIFKEGSKNIGQGGESQPGFEEFVTSGTGELAEAFVDRYYERTGKLPSQNEVQSFIADNLTPGYVGKYMKGTLGDRSVVKANLVDPYLDFSDTASIPDATSSAAGDSLSKRLDEIYGTIREKEAGNIRSEFAPSRRRAIEEEAASGRLRSGVSFGRDSAISRADENESKALSNLISQLSQSRATGEFEAAKSDKDLAERMRQFNKGLGLERSRFRQEQENEEARRAYDREALALSERIGRMQAEGRKPGTLDYLNTAFGGLSALGSFYRPKQ